MANTLLVVDLSHYDPSEDYAKVKASGIAGVIYKATQGTSFTDNTYKVQMKAAKDVGLLWGAYHFGDGTNPVDQAEHFASFTSLDGDDLFCLDWENNESNTMSEPDAKQFVANVESLLGDRVGECVLYSGNVAKEELGNRVDPFWGSRRLWLAQYTTGKPTVQASWKESGWWLWQYSDTGKIPGNSNEVDLNYFDGDAAHLASEWAHGKATIPAPVPPIPPDMVVDISIASPPGVVVNVKQTTTKGNTDKEV